MYSAVCKSHEYNIYIYIISNLYGHVKKNCCSSGLFSFMDSHFILLTVSIGFEATYFILSAMRVTPANRNTDNAVLRKAA